MLHKRLKKAGSHALDVLTAPRRAAEWAGEKLADTVYPEFRKNKKSRKSGKSRRRIHPMVKAMMKDKY